MQFDLQTSLPIILPKAIAWAEAQCAHILEVGQSLDRPLFDLATSVGVLRPEFIRIVNVSKIPLPDDPDLRQAAFASGLLGPNMIGLTLGYGIYLCQGHETVRLLSHEFRHVYQYEQAGSISKYLPAYLQQITISGYSKAPFEDDARAHEVP